MIPVPAGYNPYAAASRREALKGVKPEQLAFPQEVQDRIFDLNRALAQAEDRLERYQSTDAKKTVRDARRELRAIAHSHGLTLPQLLTAVRASTDD